jgi:integral membrane protein
MDLAAILRFHTPTARLRAVAFLEGLSYVVLLFIAMPMKYLGDMPLAVRITGSLHGFLFIWLALLALQGIRERDRSFGWATRIGVLSLVPFGTFFLDRQLEREDIEHRDA